MTITGLIVLTKFEVKIEGSFRSIVVTRDYVSKIDKTQNENPKSRIEFV